MRQRETLLRHSMLVALVARNGSTGSTNFAFPRDARVKKLAHLYHLNESVSNFISI